MITAPPARLRAFGAGLVLAIALLLAGRQITWHGWYSASPMYRAQVDALLGGRFALVDEPEGMRHDLAWTEHGVQQVWGLGVPVWQVPFEMAARAFGFAPFPDRVALLAWIALAFACVIRAWWRRDTPWQSAGSIVIAALLPAFVTLVRGRLGVYEEAAVYSYAASMMLLAGTERAGESRVRFWILCAAGGLSGFIRPTVWFYGLASAIVAGRRQKLATIAIGAAIFAAGGAALFATNAQRFGSGMEFGHRLNLESLSGNLYATRFSFPFERAGVLTAAGEELGALFDRPEKHVHTTFYGHHLHVGQSDIVRWREYYFSTYSWAYVPILLAGIVFGIKRRDRLAAWAAIGGVPLFVFYLYSPSMSSRYQLDLAPAFVALVLVAWKALAERVRPPIAAAILGVAWIAAIIFARTSEPVPPVGRDQAAREADALTNPAHGYAPIPPTYDLDDPLLPTDTAATDHFSHCAGDLCIRGERKDDDSWLVTETDAGTIVGASTSPPPLYLNLFRWDLETGEVPSATLAWVDDPQFIELELAGDPSHVRVAIGRTHLHLVSITPTTRGMRLRFEGAPLPHGLAVAFFAFGPDNDLANVHTAYRLYSIRWRAR